MFIYTAQNKNTPTMFKLNLFICYKIAWNFTVLLHQTQSYWRLLFTVNESATMYVTNDLNVLTKYISLEDEKYRLPKKKLYMF